MKPGLSGGIADALPVQQPLDAVGVGGAFLDQALALAIAPLAVLILNRRHPHTLQARGSPRRCARNARISRSRSIRSVLARRARRVSSMLDGSNP